MTISIAKTAIKSTKNLIITIILVLVISAPFITLAEMKPQLFNSLVSGVQLHHGIFRVVRWGFIAFMIFIWPTLIEYFGKKSNMPQEKIDTWKSERLRIAIWFILFELLVGENILSIILNRG